MQPVGDSGECSETEGGSSSANHAKKPLHPARYSGLYPYIERSQFFFAA